jgi:hypothetical protein
MSTFITVYLSGVVIINKNDSYEFVGMKEIFLLNEFPTLANVVHLMREWLGWMDECREVWFEGQIDITSSNGSRMKTMLTIYDEEWTAYVGVVMKSEICGIELVARMVSQNDVGDESSQLPTLPEAVDEQHIEYGVVLTQPSQETQADIDVSETPLVVSNEIVLNVKPECQSVGVGDAVADTGLISGVEPQPIATGFTLDIDPSFVEPKFMSKYEVMFGDERAEDSTEDWPVSELSKREKTLLQRALVKHAPEVPDCRDLS